MGSLALAFAASVVLGGLLACQAPINAQLGRALVSPLSAALVSVVVSSATAVTLLAVSVEAPRWSAAPAWLYVAGGVLGMLYVFGSLSLIGALGSASFFACVISGQLATGLLLDHIGAFGLVRHEISAGRIAAVGLIVAGAALLRVS